MDQMPVLGLAGNPNCGKTALFNTLTGSHQKVANYPGVTVEHREGWVTLESGQKIALVDLPGTYSLHAQTPDEEVASAIIRGVDPIQCDLLVAVVDATQLERCLNLVLEIRGFGRPMVVAINMMDLAKKRGISVDLEQLEQELGLTVIPTVALHREGVREVVQFLEKLPETSKDTFAPKATNSEALLTPEGRFQEVDRILKTCVTNANARDRLTEKLDRVLLHPVWGFVVLAAVLFLVFQAVFAWAGPFQEWIEWGLTELGVGVEALLGEGLLTSLLVDGVIAGVGSVVVFLPQILFLFLFILVLEDSGYMARAAFLMDRTMSRVGLHGRAFIPLLSSFACAIPGMMATRTIASRRDRMITLMVIPLMTCSARLPVYTVLIGAFVPERTLFLGFGLQGVVLFALYVLAVVTALVVAWVLKRTVLQGPTPPLLLEMPSYKRPALRSVVRGLWDRSLIFLKRAGTVIFSLSVLIWFASTYPRAPEGTPAEVAVEMSYAGQAGRALEPLFRPIGFDWKITAGLVPGMAAREVIVSALATVYAVGSDESSDEEIESGLMGRLKGEWPLATGLALLVWFVFAPQCVSTLAVARREMGSWTWVLLMTVYLFVLAYAGAWVTYRLFL